MKKKKILIEVLAIIVIVLLVCATLIFTRVIDITNKNVQEEKNKQEIIVEVNNSQPLRQTWLDNKKINSDYVGEIIFDSGLINKSFVQAKSVYDNNGKLYHFYTEDGNLVEEPGDLNGNDVYIWTNWKDMSYDYNDEGGSIFMDYRNSIGDQNIIIYGHHYSNVSGNDYNRQKAFTPLEKLLDEENYLANKNLKLILDKQTISYELVGVYKYDIYDENCVNNLQYYRTNYNYDEYEDVYDDTYYQNYIDALNQVKLYKTDATLSTNDKTLTLQTCISGLDGLEYEICVFKQVESIKY